MVTGIELKNFGDEHGFFIPPYRDYDEWAINHINPLGGRCPCNKDRTCPCIESIADIANAPTQDTECCTCRFYCSQGYIDHWTNEWKRQGLIKKEKQTNEKPDNEEPDNEQTNVEQREIKNTDIREIVETLNEAARHIMLNDPGKAYEILSLLSETSHCSICVAVMRTEAARAMMLAEENTIEKEEYEIDKQRAMDRLKSWIDVYTKVDISMDVNEIPQKDETDKEQTKKEGFRDTYHACMSKVMSHPEIKGTIEQPRERFGIAHMYCTGKAETVDKAIKQYKDGKKE